MLVKDIMNKSVQKISEDATVKNAAKTMVDKRVGSLIVVSKDRLVGIVTERDMMMKVVAKGLVSAKTTVKSIMTKNVVIIKPDADVEDAAELMVKYNIKKLPVVVANKMIGIITSMDVVAAQPKFLDNLSHLLLFQGKKKVVAG